MGRILAIGIAALLALSLAAYFFTGKQDDSGDAGAGTNNVQSGDSPPMSVKRQLDPPPADIVEAYQLSGQLPDLNDSDIPLFSHLRILLEADALSLLNDDQFLRKVVLQVENAAAGNFIYQHSPVIGPEAEFQAAESEDVLSINSDSYVRYSGYAEIADSLDTGLVVAFYQFYEPLLEQAYEELGYSGDSFRFRLLEAIDQVLAAPLLDEPPLLYQPEVNYVFADPALEALNGVQKQLVRMGPENSRKIQDALRRFKLRIQ